MRRMGSISSGFNCLDAADPAILEPDLDAVRMVCGAGKNIFDDPPGLFAAVLVLLEDDGDGLSRIDIFAVTGGQNFTPTCL